MGYSLLLYKEEGARILLLYTYYLYFGGYRINSWPLLPLLTDIEFSHQKKKQVSLALLLLCLVSVILETIGKK